LEADRHGSHKVTGALYFLGNIVAFKTAGAYLQGNRRAFQLGFYLFQVWLPDPAGTVIGMTYRIAGNGMFSADIAGS
jgi:hypothetical protein